MQYLLAQGTGTELAQRDVLAKKALAKYGSPPPLPRPVGAMGRAVAGVAPSGKRRRAAGGASEARSAMVYPARAAAPPAPAVACNMPQHQGDFVERRVRAALDDFFTKNGGGEEEEDEVGELKKKMRMMEEEMRRMQANMDVLMAFHKAHQTPEARQTPEAPACKTEDAKEDVRVNEAPVAPTV